MAKIMDNTLDERFSQLNSETRRAVVPVAGQLGFVPAPDGECGDWYIDTKVITEQEAFHSKIRVGMGRELGPSPEADTLRTAANSRC